MRNTLCILMLSLLASCSTDLSQYAKSTPQFKINNYFSGSVTGWGIVQDYQNKVTRRFCVDLVGTWNGNKGELAEVFYFADGEVSQRTWQLTVKPDGSYQGTAADVVGIANGRETGFAFQLEYQLLVPVDDTVYQMSMDDWMYKIDEYKVFNRTSMNKFGVQVAEITLFFDKKPPVQSCR